MSRRSSTPPPKSSRKPRTLAELWITDASPLIALAKLGETQLLTDLSEELIVPEAVAEEVLAGEEGDPARQLLESGFGRRAQPTVVSPRLHAWALGRGETAALALGLEIEGSRVILDDLAARRCARSLGRPMIGTLGVIIRARQLGMIPSAAKRFHALREADFRIDDTIARTVLERVGETWPRG